MQALMQVGFGQDQYQGWDQPLHPSCYPFQHHSFTNLSSYQEKMLMFENTEQGYGNQDCFPSPPILPSDFPISDFPLEETLQGGIFPSPDSWYYTPCNPVEKSEPGI